MALVDFTISCDPEFVIQNEFQENLTANHYCTIEDDFGCDGGGQAFELRPSYSTCPLEVVTSIRSLLFDGAKRYRSLLKHRWLAGSYQENCSLGGHQHFGTKHKIKPESAVHILDNYLGSVSLLLENNRRARLRRNENYGLISDWREQDHGFEYRVCSSWITSPYIATAILCLGKTIMFEILNNKKFNWDKFVTPNTFRLVQKNDLYTKFPKIWSDIKKMKLYQRYKPHLDLIYFLVNKKLTWHLPVDMKEAWGIVDLSSLTRQQILFGTIWAKYKMAVRK